MRSPRFKMPEYQKVNVEPALRLVMDRIAAIGPLEFQRANTGYFPGQAGHAGTQP